MSRLMIAGTDYYAPTYEQATADFRRALAEHKSDEPYYAIVLTAHGLERVRVTDRLFNDTKEPQ